MKMIRTTLRRHRNALQVVGLNTVAARCRADSIFRADIFPAIAATAWGSCQYSSARLQAAGFPGWSSSHCDRAQKLAHRRASAGRWAMSTSVSERTGVSSCRRRSLAEDRPATFHPDGPGGQADAAGHRRGRQPSCCLTADLPPGTGALGMRAALIHTLYSSGSTNLLGSLLAALLNRRVSNSQLARLAAGRRGGRLPRTCWWGHQDASIITPGGTLADCGVEDLRLPLPGLRGPKGAGIESVRTNRSTSQCLG